MPGVVILTALLEIERPVPKSPIWLMGEGLHEEGWQVAYTDAAPGKDARIEPVPPAEMSSGLVDW